MNEFKSRFSKVSLGLASTALGIMTLGNTWAAYDTPGMAKPVFNFDVSWLPKLTLAIGIILLITVLIRSFSNLRDFYEHMKSGAKSSHLPVILLVFESIGEFFTNLDPTSTTSFVWYFGNIFWWIGVVGYYIYLVWWVVTRTMWFKFEDLDAAYVIPSMGFAVACAVSPSFMTAYGAFIGFMWYWSLTVYLILIIFITYRYLFFEPMHKAELPAIGIICSPASLLLATYFNVFGFNGDLTNAVIVPGPVMIYALGIISLGFAFITYLSMAKTWITKFTNDLGSYTFPTAINALAALLFSFYAGMHGLGEETVRAFRIISLVEIIISTLVIGYILFGNVFTTVFMLSRPSNSQKPSNKFYLFFVEKMYK